MPDARDASNHDAVRPGGKSATAFRTISEVADELDVPQHVLRFWESKFPQVKPLKRAGGRRYYRPEDVVLLRTIRELLYRQGYTIKGAQKLLRETGARKIPADGSGETPGAERGTSRAEADAKRVGNTSRPIDRTELKAVLDELVSLRALVRQRFG
ncbi:MAG TPA: MerR family transcriptional regulator [Alphaproteobacteria bacterium]|nr:MerR family transcriptional regulator [Alphaproteobacteria bacterium]